MQDELTNLLEDAKQAVTIADDITVIEQLRVKYLGKKGELTELLKSVGQRPAAERPKLGKAINIAKQKLHELLTEQEALLRQKALQKQLESERIDITQPGRNFGWGSDHPVQRVSQRCIDIFMTMGFTVAQGPEIEEEYYNFTALNFTEHHPAKDELDTFYFPNGKLLRTHTSPVQIRVMEKQKPPLRVITPGRVYRRDSDQTHTPMFHQLEGLVVAKECTFANLKGLLQQFFERFFEADIKLRFRPSYFPFTEPSAEVDLQISENSGWLEVLGCGMVHPNVLSNVNIDPDEYSGFAFGLGLDRMAMLRYRIPDLRMMFENDIRFLEQF